jgi:hypothetical protein
MTDTRTVTVSGLDASIRMPYRAGYTINEHEADELNARRVAVVTNAWRTRIKRRRKSAVVGDGSVADSWAEGLREELEQYDSQYQLGERPLRGPRTARPKADPVEREARAIVLKSLKEQLRQAGKKLDDFDRAAIEQLIATNAQQPDVLEYARQEVENKKRQVRVNGLDQLQQVQSAA